MRVLVSDKLAEEGLKILKKEKAFEFIKGLSKKHYVVVLCGGGEQINKAFKEKGLEIEFGPAGRKTTFKGRQISRDVLEKNQKEIQDKFIKREIKTFEDYIGVGLLVAIVAYLIAGLANDSVVSVAPVFWALLGMGISINLRNKK